MGSLFKRKERGPWWMCYRDGSGKQITRSCRTPDKQAARRLLSELESQAALRRSGVVDEATDRYTAAEKRPLVEHLNDWHSDLVARGTGEKHAQQMLHYATRIAELARAEKLSELTPSSVQGAIGQLKRDGSSAATRNRHLTAVKGFARWCWKDKRTREHGLAHLSAENAARDPRRQRRNLQAEELHRLIAAAEAGPERYGLSGADRAMLYRIASGSGFRVGECASLVPESFILGDPPSVVCESAYTKNGERAEQPIRADLAQRLGPWLATKTPGRPVLDTPRLNEKSAKLIRADLADARAAWLAEAGESGPERERRERSDFLRYQDAAGRYCDAHSLRHSYITSLVSGGASVRIAQQLARHSTPTLTLNHYSHSRLADHQRALDHLPGEPEPPHASDASAG